MTGADIPLPGPLADRFEVEAVLAADGSRWVGRVRSIPEGRPLILKALDSGRVDPEVAARFRREVAALSRLEHQRVVRILEHGEAEGIVFLLAPDPGADTLQARLAEGPMAAPAAERMLEQLLEALLVVHEEGLVHRDVTPANVLVLPDGNVQLLDFGIARPLDSHTRLTETGELLGTPAWMAPEQVMGKAPDPRDDLYALGLLLYTALTGGNPMEQGDLEEVLHRQMHEGLPPLGRECPGLPDALVALVTDLTAKRREDRPDSARAALARLRPEERSPEPEPEPEEAEPGRAPGGGGLALVVIGALAGGLLFLRASPAPGPSAPASPVAATRDADLAALERVLAASRDYPEIVDGLEMVGNDRTPETLRRWERARARFDSKLTDLEGPLERLRGGALDPSSASLVHQLWIRAELLRRTASPEGIPDREVVRPLRELATTVVSIHPGPWVDTPRREARDLSLEYVKQLSRAGTRWRPLRRAEDYRMLSGGAVRDEDGLKHVNEGGVAFVDPVIDRRIQTFSSVMKETIDYPRDDVPEEIAVPLAEGTTTGKDLWLAFVMREWRRTSVPDLALVGREQTVRLSFDAPGDPAHGRGTFRGTLLVRVDGSVVPEGARRFYLRARALQPFASPHQISRVAEVLQLVEGEVGEGLLAEYARGTRAAWSF